ncbi:uncharacterized protein LOC135484314 [Lineus longissimus]|uniref:uncharacterized protein LOC135484314 n=1 Tax=Lineus longissimus TaxID=88925 RepID=UPI00315DF429
MDKELHENLAYKRKAFQSTTSKRYSGEAYRAVDGVTSSKYSAKSCTHTEVVPSAKTRQWWSVDLGTRATVKVVKITNRGDCCWTRLKKFTIVVSGDAPNSKTFKATKANICFYEDKALTKGETKSFTCLTAMKGRFVTIIKQDKGVLTLCEVQVFGDKLPTPSEKKKNLRLDLIILIDASKYTGNAPFHKAKKLLFTLLDSFNVGPQSILIRLIHYASTPKLYVMNSPAAVENYVKVIKGLKYLGTLPSMPKALAEVEKLLKNKKNWRKGVPKAGFCLGACTASVTDSKATIRTLAGIYRMNLRLYASLIGDDLNHQLKHDIYFPQHMLVLSLWNKAELKAKAIPWINSMASDGKCAWGKVYRSSKCYQVACHKGWVWNKMMCVRLRDLKAPLKKPIVYHLSPVKELSHNLLPGQKIAHEIKSRKTVVHHMGPTVAVIHQQTGEQKLVHENLPGKKLVHGLKPGVKVNETLKAGREVVHHLKPGEKLVHLKPGEKPGEKVTGKPGKEGGKLVHLKPGEKPGEKVTGKPGKEGGKGVRAGRDVVHKVGKKGSPEKLKVVLHHTMKMKGILHHGQIKKDIHHGSLPSKAVIHHALKLKGVVHHGHREKVIMHHSRGNKVLIHHLIEAGRVLHHKAGVHAGLIQHVHTKSGVLHHGHTAKGVVHHRTSEKGVLLHGSSKNGVLHHAHSEEGVLHHGKKTKEILHHAKPVKDILHHGKKTQDILHHAKPVKDILHHGKVGKDILHHSKPKKDILHQEETKEDILHHGTKKKNVLQHVLLKKVILHHGIPRANVLHHGKFMQGAPKLEILHHAVLTKVIIAHGKKTVMPTCPVSNDKLMEMKVPEKLVVKDVDKNELQKLKHTLEKEKDMPIKEVADLIKKTMKPKLTPAGCPKGTLFGKGVCYVCVPREHASRREKELLEVMRKERKRLAAEAKTQSKKKKKRVKLADIIATNKKQNRVKKAVSKLFKKLHAGKEKGKTKKIAVLKKILAESKGKLDEKSIDIINKSIQNKETDKQILQKLSAYRTRKVTGKMDSSLNMKVIRKELSKSKEFKALPEKKKAKVIAKKLYARLQENIKLLAKNLSKQKKHFARNMAIGTNSAKLAAIDGKKLMKELAKKQKNLHAAAKAMKRVVKVEATAVPHWEMPTLKPKEGTKASESTIKSKKLRKVVSPKNAVKLKHLKKVHFPKRKSTDKSLKSIARIIEKEAKLKSKIKPRLTTTEDKTIFHSLPSNVVMHHKKSKTSKKPKSLASEKSEPKRAKLKSIHHTLPSNVVMHHTKPGTSKKPKLLASEKSEPKRAKHKSIHHTLPSNVVMHHTKTGTSKKPKSLASEKSEPKRAKLKSIHHTLPSDVVMHHTKTGTSKKPKSLASEKSRPKKAKLKSIHHTLPSNVVMHHTKTGTSKKPKSLASEKSEPKRAKIKSIHHTLPSNVVMHHTKTGTSKKPKSLASEKSRPKKAKLKSIHHTLPSNVVMDETKSGTDKKPSIAIKNIKTKEKPSVLKGTPKLPSTKELKKLLAAEEAKLRQKPELTTEEPAAANVKVVTSQPQTTEKPSIIKGTPKLPSNKELKKLLDAEEAKLRHKTKLTRKEPIVANVKVATSEPQTTEKPSIFKGTPKLPSNKALKKLLKAEEAKLRQKPELTKKEPIVANVKVATSEPQTTQKPLIIKGTPKQPSNKALKKLLKAEEAKLRQKPELTRKEPIVANVKVATSEPQTTQKPLIIKGTPKQPSNKALKKLLKAEEAKLKVKPESAKKPTVGKLNIRPSEASAQKITRVLSEVAANMKVTAAPGMVKSKIDQKIKLKTASHQLPTKVVMHHIRLKSGTSKHPKVKLLKKGFVKKPKMTAKPPSKKVLAKLVKAANASVETPVGTTSKISSKKVMAHLSMAAKSSTIKPGKVTPLVPSTPELEKLLKDAEALKVNGKNASKTPTQKMTDQLVKAANCTTTVKTAVTTPKAPTTKELDQLLKAAEGTSKKHTKDASKTSSIETTIRLSKAIKGTTREPAIKVEPTTPSTEEIGKLMKPMKAAEVISKQSNFQPKESSEQDLAKLITTTKETRQKPPKVSPKVPSGQDTAKVMKAAEETAKIKHIQEKLTAKSTKRPSYVIVKTTVQSPKIATTATNAKVTSKASAPPKITQVREISEEWKKAVRSKHSTTKKVIRKAPAVKLKTPVASTPNAHSKSAKKESASEAIMKVLAKSGRGGTVKLPQSKTTPKVPIEEYLAKLLAKATTTIRTLSVGKKPKPKTASKSKMVELLKQTKSSRKPASKKDSSSLPQATDNPLPTMASKGKVSTTETLASVVKTNELLSGKKVEKLLRSQPKKSTTRSPTIDAVTKPTAAVAGKQTDATNDLGGPPSFDHMAEKDILNALEAGDKTKGTAEENKENLEPPDMNKLVAQVEHKSKIPTAKKTIKKTPSMERMTNIYGLENASWGKGQKPAASAISKSLLKQLSDDAGDKVKTVDAAGRTTGQPTAKNGTKKTTNKRKGSKETAKARSTSDLVVDQDLLKQLSGETTKKPPTSTMVPGKASSAKTDVFKRLSTHTEKLKSHTKKLNQHTTLGKNLLEQALATKTKEHIKTSIKHTEKTDKLIGKTEKQVGLVKKLLKQTEKRPNNTETKNVLVNTNTTKKLLKDAKNLTKSGILGQGVGSSAKSDIIKQLSTNSEKLKSDTDTHGKHTTLTKKLLKQVLATKTKKEIKSTMKQTEKTGKLIGKTDKRVGVLNKLLKQTEVKKSAGGHLFEKGADKLSTKQVVKVAKSNPVISKQLLERANKNTSSGESWQTGSKKVRVKQQAATGLSLPVDDLRRIISDSNNKTKGSTPSKIQLKQQLKTAIGTSNKEITRKKSVTGSGVGTCQDTDVAFVLDSSTGVTEKQFKTAKDFVKAIIGDGGFTSSKDRMALVRYSSKAYINWHAGFDWFDDKKELHEAIDDLPRVPGNRDTGAALDVVRSRLFTKLGGMRKRSKKVAVIITNGDTNDQPIFEKEAKALKSMEVDIYAIAIGKGVTLDKLKTAVSASGKRHVFAVDKYRNLSKVMQPFQEATCIGVEKLPGG